MADADLRRLIERAQNGDAAAFEALYDRFERSTYALCLHLLGDRHKAEEAVQETFVNVYEKLPTLRHPEAFASWLRSAAINACRHQQRKRRWLRAWSEVGSDDAPELEVADEAPDGAEAALAGELGREVQAALGRLSPEHREVVVLHHLDGLPLADIAAAVGVAEGTVKSRLGRARAHLERLLSPYLGEDER